MSVSLFYSMISRSSFNLNDKHCKASLSFGNERYINSCIIAVVIIIINIIYYYYYDDDDDDDDDDDGSLKILNARS